MTNSRADSAVQELPTTNRKVSTIRPTEAFEEQAQAIPATEVPAAAGIPAEALDDEILFDDEELIDEELEIEAPEETTESEAAELEADAAPPSAAYPTRAIESASIDAILSQLRGPLAQALQKAESVLEDPARVEKWFARHPARRLAALAERFTQELEDTERKRAAGDGSR